MGWRAQRSIRCEGTHPSTALTGSGPGREGAERRRSSRAHARARTYEATAHAPIRHHLYMSSFPRCAAKLRDGRPCNRTVVEGSEFRVHHTGLVGKHDAEILKRGLPRRKEAKAAWKPRLVTLESETIPPSISDVVTADPATVRPRLAEAAAGSLDEISRVLLEAATGATKKQWADFERECGRRKRVEVPIPDVRVRVAAIELLLREGLGRAPQADESSTPRIRQSVEDSSVCRGRTPSSSSRSTSQTRSQWSAGKRPRGAAGEAHGTGKRGASVAARGASNGCTLREQDRPRLTTG
jgi:hypothetical protein